MSSLASTDRTQLADRAFPLAPMICATVLVALVLLVFSDFFHAQWKWATRHQADWGHTLVIPLIAAYFVFLKREQLLAKPFKTTWIGLLIVVLGVAWYFFCAVGPPTLRHHNLLGAGVAMTITGLVLLFCGFRAMYWLWFPLAYLFLFGQPISEQVMNIITFKLQDIAARGSHVLFILIGMDVDRAGNNLTLYTSQGPKALNIAEACSGMRMLMAFVALGVAMAHIGLKRFWQQAILVALAVPTAIFVNMLRVVTLGLLTLIDSDFAAGDFHTFIGLLWLIPAFLIYLGLMWIVTHIVVEVPEKKTKTSSAGASS